MKIIGSGLAGLLAANMLRRMNPQVHEAQPSLPNNHAALLRFRSDVCAKATGIPFKKVAVRKAICVDGKLTDQTNIALNNQYSQKVTGSIVDRSIINLNGGDRYIAPDNFISQMASSVKIVFDSPFTKEELLTRNERSEPLLSTIPMPMLMDMVGWKEKPDFAFSSVWSVTAKIPDCEVYQTIYYPDQDETFYRASITGDRLIVECLDCPPDVLIPDLVSEILEHFGIRKTVPEHQVKHQKYGKLKPLKDPAAARRFMLYMTDKFRVYSLGRFATWRQLLLDDVVKDVGIIERLIEYRDSYQHTLENFK